MNEFALELICCDGRIGLIEALLLLPTELIESVRWPKGRDGIGSPPGKEGSGGA